VVLVFGDQLDSAAAAFDGFDPKRDGGWIAKVEEEATHVCCHKDPGSASLLGEAQGVDGRYCRLSEVD
jgi:hypothetical protein